MMVAAGPFCLRDGLDYSPLDMVLHHATEVGPQALVLLGPFVDMANLKVSSGETTIEGEEEPLTFEEIYTDIVLPTLLRGVQALRRSSPSTQVFLVPSVDDALSFHPMPQPPLDIALGLEAGVFAPLKGLGVRLLSNPAHLQLGGLRVTLSSADALSPVLRDLVLRPPEKRIEEALRLLLLQRTLFPTIPRDPPQVSETRAEALGFPGGECPDVCVFPALAGVASATFVEGSVFVNPGPVCRAQLGTFAELVATPAAPVHAGLGAPLRERVRVDIHKLAA